LDRFALGKLPPNEVGLSAHASKTGERKNFHAVVGRGVLHVTPRLRGGRDQSDRTSVIGRGPDRGESGSLTSPREVSLHRIIGRNSKRVVKLAQMSAGNGRHAAIQARPGEDVDFF
jgi:hypothetical protein